jgi:hypothetical protein
VAFPYFRHIFDSLSSDGVEWTGTESTSFVSAYFPDNVRGRYTADQGTEFVEKSSLSTFDCSCDGRDYDLRICLRLEKPVTVTFDAARTPHFFRLHHRWSFTYKNAWRYDISKVASGPSKELACKSTPVFEVELELLRDSEFLAQTSDRDIACHILEKLQDLLGRFSESGLLSPARITCSNTWSAHGQHQTRVPIGPP